MQNIVMNFHLAVLNNYYLYNDLTSGLNKIFNSGRLGIMGIALAVAGFFVAFGGLCYQTGSAEMVAKGKKHIIHACVGMVLAFGALAVVTWIKSFVSF